VEFALQQQLSTDYIDIIMLNCVPQDLPTKESGQAMGNIVGEGKARHIGLSEASAKVICRAHTIHPVYCIKQEWRLVCHP